MLDDITLVTGGAGFIGSNIVQMLAEEDRDVVVSDRFQHPLQWEYLAPFLVRDLIPPENLLVWLERHLDSVSTIVHMGAISSTTETDASYIIRENIRFTLDLWDYSRRHGKTFVYASSAATYGDGSAGFVDDDTPAGLAQLRPLNLYGWSKHFVDRRVIDDVVKKGEAPVRWAGLKFFNVYGPNEAHKGSMRSVVHQIYPLAARGETIRLFKSAHSDYPDGGQLRDFIYVKDCCEIVRRILAADSVAGIYNVGTGRARSFEDLAKAVFSAVGREPVIEYIDMPEALLARYQYYTQADTTKLERHELAPAFSELESGIADYVTEHLRALGPA